MNYSVKYRHRAIKMKKSHRYRKHEESSFRTRNSNPGIAKHSSRTTKAYQCTLFLFLSLLLFYVVAVMMAPTKKNRKEKVLLICAAVRERSMYCSVITILCMIPTRMSTNINGEIYLPIWVFSSCWCFRAAQEGQDPNVEASEESQPEEN